MAQRKNIASILLVSVLVSSCTTTKEIVDWRNLPKHKTIEVVTTSGESHTFDSWLIRNDTTLVIITVDQSSSVVIPAGHIQAAYIIDKKLHTAILIAGAVLTIGVIWYVIDFLSKGVGVGKVQ